MEPLRHSIQTLFLRQNPLVLVKNFLDNDGEYMAEHLENEYFKLLYREDFSSFTLDQIESLYNILATKWMKEDPRKTSLRFLPGSSVFNPLLYFAEYVLLEHNHEPICQYQHLLRWHEITQMVSEDLLTLPFLAARDSRLGVETRNNFEWPAIIGHNNSTLNHIMHSRDVAELHAHLKGSSLTFELSWISLMNSIDNRGSQFEGYKHYQNANIHVVESTQGSLYNSVKIAAVIRLFLFDRLNGFAPRNIYQDLQQLSSAETTGLLPSGLQNDITARQECCLLYDMGSYGESVVLDYAIPKSFDPTLMSVLAGERQLLYRAFRALIDQDNNNLQKKECKEIQMLLFIYLVIKLKLRSEMIQNNKFVGFANFSIYENRKSEFLEGKFKHLVPAMAVRNFCDVNPEHRYFEARLVPAKKAEEMEHTINETDYDVQFLLNSNSIDHIGQTDKEGVRKYDCRYILHFIKKAEDKANISSDMHCRHHHNRKEYQEQGQAIYDFRRQSRNRNLVVAIDAANSEIFCRPEVFAQVFRMLRNQTIQPDIHTQLGNSIPQDLGITYHVGEDFMDIIDGLRALDEVFYFIGLQNGDRIGHGLVLGTNARVYYQQRGMMLTLKRQDWLDNVAWMYHECCKANCGNAILQWLRSEFREAFARIYGIVFDDGEYVDLDTYYLSWLLRGDNPEIYFEEQLSDNPREPLSDWERENRNSHPSSQKARKNRTAQKLYRAYHYNPIVKQHGEESVAIKVPEEYVEATIVIQQAMLDVMQKHHIAIECNPTSNFRIGEFVKYAAHPLVKFFNYGLDTNYPSHAIPISINTDDSGVFATSVEREYALIALSLEKDAEFSKRNPPHAIYDWLDRIREMSQEQRFYKKEEDHRNTF